MDPKGKEEKPPVLETISFLKEHGLDTLIRRFQLNYHRHSEHTNLVQLKYDQVASEFSSGIVQECRGLIVDENSWKIVVFPYRKFFNYMETQAAKINWNEKVQVQEKVDGSLATLYWYNGAWHVASSSVPDGSGSLKTVGISFADLFWDVWKNLKYELPKHKNRCYMFELLSPRNTIIVRPTREAIILHGVRNMDTLLEEEPQLSKSTSL